MPCSASRLTNSSIRGREYGGLSHTRPFHSRDNPSMCLSYMTVAVRHRGYSGAHGSKSKGPSASMISLGVYHSSVELYAFSNDVFIFLVDFQETHRPVLPFWAASRDCNAGTLESHSSLGIAVGESHGIDASLIGYGKQFKLLDRLFIVPMGYHECLTKFGGDFIKNFLTHIITVGIPVYLQGLL